MQSRPSSSFKFVVLLALAATGGCATIVGDNDPAEVSPEGSTKGKTGTVVYNPDGLKEIVDMRRKDALEKIVAFCGGRTYTIDSEKDVDAKDSNDSSIATAAASRVHELKFTCTK